MTAKQTQYEKEVRQLFSLQKFGIKFGLSKTSNLLQAMGNPQQGQLYIHIAGTNGKGSVASYLSSILQQEGLKVGMYTSPHLVRFTERFQINSREIERTKAAELIYELRQHFDPQEPPTFFEAATALALTYFAQENTDISIIEVGMGGRLDATNIIHPLVSVITNISLEHKEFLGDSILQVAQEKAGIIKQFVPVVTAVNQSPVIELFQTICQQKNAPLYALGKDFDYQDTEVGLNYYGLKMELNNLQPNLFGQHQHKNAALALAALEVLNYTGIKTSIEHIRSGLQETIWPGRMQIVSQEPLIILDGAHNPAAMQALSQTIVQRYTYKRLFLVLGIMADKDIEAMIKEVIPIADYIIYTRPKYTRALNPHVLMKKAMQYQKPGEVVEDITSVLDKVLYLAENRDLIVVCGSLFTVGEAISFFEPEKYMPEEI